VAFVGQLKNFSSLTYFISSILESDWTDHGSDAEEDDAQIGATLTDTVTCPDHMIEDIDQIAGVNTRTIELAPGEDRPHASIYTNPDVPFLAFPDCFAGQDLHHWIKKSEAGIKEPDDDVMNEPADQQKKDAEDRKKFAEEQKAAADGAKTSLVSSRNSRVRSDALYWSEFLKLLMRHIDDRLRSCPEGMFYFTKLIQQQQVLSKVNIELRKGGNLPDSIDDLLNDKWREGALKDSCFQHLDSVRMSPAYWSKFKKDVFAMLRQFGSPQFFVSVSCADQRWFKVMAQISGKTELEVSGMTWAERNVIIQQYPDQYARMFQNRINLMFNDEVPVHKNGFLGHVFHRIWRFEFQKRGRSDCPYLYCSGFYITIRTTNFR